MSDLFGLRGSLDGSLLTVLGEKLSAIRAEGIQKIRHHVASSHSVYPDSMLDGLNCQGPSDLRNGSLRRGVSNDSRECLETSVRSDVYDGAQTSGESSPSGLRVNEGTPR